MDAQNLSEAERREHEKYWLIAWFAKERNRLRNQQAIEHGRMSELVAERQEEYSWCPHPTAGGFGLFAQNHLGTQQIPTSRLELADWLNGHAEHVEILRQFEQSEHSEESHSGKTLRDAVEIGEAAFGIGSVLFERITGNKPSLSPKLDTAQNCVASIKQLVGLITKLKPEANVETQDMKRLVAALAAVTENKPKKKKRNSTRPAHRPVDTDLKADEKDANEWLRGRNSGEFRFYNDMARKQSRDVGPLKDALDRDRHRRPEVWTAKRKPRRKKAVKSD